MFGKYVITPTTLYAIKTNDDVNRMHEYCLRSNSNGIDVDSRVVHSNLARFCRRTDAIIVNYFKVKIHIQKNCDEKFVFATKIRKLLKRNVIFCSEIYAFVHRVMFDN